MICAGVDSGYMESASSFAIKQMAGIDTDCETQNPKRPRGFDRGGVLGSRRKMNMGAPIPDGLAALPAAGTPDIS